jgi:enoyl-CoA hydratase
VGIGFIPDVGATWFLSRMPGKLGLYCALTGARVGADDAVFSRVATHRIGSQRVPDLIEGLYGTVSVDALLAAFAEPAGEGKLAKLAPHIDRLFAGDSIEAILAALAAEAAAGGVHAGWAAETRAGLLTKSPTSLKVTLRQLTIGRGYDLDAALRLEYRLTQHMMAGHDFYEGVRAALIDKDQSPRWRPASLAAVTDEMVDAYFAPIADRELR